MEAILGIPKTIGKAVGVLLAITSPTISMEIVYSNKLKIEPSWLQIAMNEGRSVFIPVHFQNPITLWTDQLKGCVVTLIHLEHLNGDRTVSMCHFSPDKKSYNESYLNNFLASLEHENKLSTIKKAACIIIPPGIAKTNRITPILDPEWKHIITQTLKSHIQNISFNVQPYFYNIDSSSVQYSIDSKKTRTVIINKSQQIDHQHLDWLMVCHNLKEDSVCNKILPLMVATSGLIGFFIYNSN